MKTFTPHVSLSAPYREQQPKLHYWNKCLLTIIASILFLLNNGLAQQRSCPESPLALSTNFPFSIMPSRCGPGVPGDGRINVKPTGFTRTYKMELLASPDLTQLPHPITNPLAIIPGETRTGQTASIFTFYGLKPSVYYCVRLTDEVTGCYVTIDVAIICLNSCPDIALSGNSIIQLVCPAVTGTINVNVSRPNSEGPNGMYIYFYRLFYDDNGTLKPYLVNGQPVEGSSGNPVLTLNNLPPDYYCVLVQDEHTACIKQIDIVILPCEEKGNEGCTPGYWKNHTGSWTPTGYLPGQTLESVFDVPNSLDMDNTTLLQALQGGGGSGVVGAAKILLRAATSALLNAAHPNVDYPRSIAQIIEAVNSALASNNRDKMLKLATSLDNDNNLGCSIDAHGRAKSERSPSSQISDRVTELNIRVLPNPSYGAFNLQIASGSSERITMRIRDMQGRLIEQFQNVRLNQQLNIGQNYKAGVYFIELTQGKERKQLKLVKIK